MAHLERRKRYLSGARSRGEQGTAYVRFRIDDGGNVLSASLARSSGFPALDNEVVEMVRRASPVPAPPPGSTKPLQPRCALPSGELAKLKHRLSNERHAHAA